MKKERTYLRRSQFIRGNASESEGLGGTPSDSFRRRAKGAREVESRAADHDVSA